MRKQMAEDFQYKIYEKFTELFVSQKGITDTLKVFDGKIENLAMSMSNFHIRVDKIQEGILKNENILLRMQILVKTITMVVSLSLGSIFIFKETLRGFGESIFKFFWN